MESVFNCKNECFGCTLCLHNCPVSAISMHPDDEGFLYPIIDKATCTDCGLCANICPYNAKNNYKATAKPDFYVAIHKSEDVLMRSTSGGAFTALSDVILKEGGVVYGVDFDNEYKVYHTKTTTAEGRNRMRFSKYVQSDLSDIFVQIANDLKQGKTVYFTGTPCQCAGLRGHIAVNNVSDEKLFITDVICYGIPSPLIWEEYKRYLEDTYGGKLTHISFRSKKLGWSRANSNKLFELKVSGNDELIRDDKFNFLFLQHQLIMRPSCSNCSFCDAKRASDVTIADYWGIEKFSPEWFDSRGVSVILVNTPKGEALFKVAGAEMRYEKRAESESMAEQGRLSVPVPPGKSHDRFWSNYHKSGFKAALEIELKELNS